MNPPTRISFSLLFFLTLTLLIACARPTATQTANANANQAASTQPSSGPGARVDKFVGSWGGYSGRSSAVSGQVSLDSRFMNTVVKQTGPGAVIFEGDIWQAKGSLRYDAAADKYLLSFEAEDFPKLTDVPLKFSGAEGYAGEATLSQKGKEAKATVTIKDEQGTSHWSMRVNQGKDMWSFRIALGKEK
jgi:hypothetical protein